jgi:hypothetical protein
MTCYETARRSDQETRLEFAMVPRDARDEGHGDCVALAQRLPRGTQRPEREGKDLNLFAHETRAGFEGTTDSRVLRKLDLDTTSPSRNPPAQMGSGRFSSPEWRIDVAQEAAPLRVKVVAGRRRRLARPAHQPPAAASSLVGTAGHESPSRPAHSYSLAPGRHGSQWRTVASFEAVSELARDASIPPEPASQAPPR